MKMWMALSVVAAAGLTACSNESGSPVAGGGGIESAAPAATLSADQKAKVDKAVAVRTALEAGQDADAVLKANGLTEEQFDALLFEIAEDEAMSAEYAARTGP